MFHALLTAGCGITPVHADSAGAGDRVYTTGSNIARKPGDVGTPTAAVAGRDAAEDQLKLHQQMPLPPGGR